MPLKKNGANYTARCPFHDEKTPSFSVSPDKQFYYCFGCGAGGNAIGFVMEYERLEFPEAVEMLAQSVGLTVPREQGNERSQPQKKRPDLYDIMARAEQWFQEQLKQHPRRERAVDYLKGRGLDGEICRRFGIGYAPPGWDNLLEALGDNDSDRKLLIEAGMLVNREEEGKCYDRFRDRIMFPIHDSRGRTIAFGGRVLDPEDNPKYLNSPETPIFHKGRELYGLYEARQAQRNLQRVLIVEGYMDVVALAQNGVSECAATLGTATSTDHLRKLMRYTSEVVFCFDGDNAGRKAANRALESALPVMEDGRSARFLFLPEGEDPDSLIRARGHNGFVQALNEAVPLEEYLFQAQGEDANGDSMESRARLGKRAAPLIQQLPEGMFRQLMQQELARRTGLDQNALDRIVVENPAPAEPAQPRRREPLPQRPKHSSPPAMLRLLANLLHQPAAASALPPTLAAIAGEPYADAVATLAALLRQNPDWSAARLMGHCMMLPEADAYRAALGLEIVPPNRELAAEEISEIFLDLDRKRDKNALQASIEALSQRDLASLSDDERAALLEALDRVHRKSRG